MFGARCPQMLCAPTGQLSGTAQKIGPPLHHVGAREEVHAGGGGHLGSQSVDGLRSPGETLRAGATLILEPRLDVAEPIGVEQLLQQRTPFLVARPQEPREVPLRQQDDLEELVHPHAEQALDLERDLVDARQVLAPAVVPRQRRLGVLFRGSHPAPLGAQKLRLPDDGEAAATQRRVEFDARNHTRCSVIRQQASTLSARAGENAVESEGDGVENGRLSRSGGAVQEEEAVGPEIVEVDVDRAAERPERGDRQRMQSHAERTHSCSTGDADVESR